MRDTWVLESGGAEVIRLARGRRRAVLAGALTLVLLATGVAGALVWTNRDTTSRTPALAPESITPAEAETETEVEAQPEKKKRRPKKKTVAPALSTDEAVALLEEQGFYVFDASTYDENAPLSALVGDGCEPPYNTCYVHHVFFFVNGMYAGTATPEPVGSTPAIQSASGDTISVDFYVYSRGDALCCPSSQTTIRYQASGDSVHALDLVPSAEALGGQ